MGGTAVRHARLRQRMAALADGELAGEEKRLAEEHVLACRKCRRELALQRELARALAREPAPVASPGLRRRIESSGAVGRPHR